VELVGSEEVVAVVREERRVSGSPGAEGAPLGWTECFEVAAPVAVDDVLEVLVGWAAGGAMRRD
jgi:hypothetical protein